MITRCVCADRSFAEMHCQARDLGLDLEGLRREFGCGQSCGLCVPYLQDMLRTGRTEFDPDKPVPQFTAYDGDDVSVFDVPG